jgi:hypothetical protein
MNQQQQAQDQTSATAAADGQPVNKETESNAFSVLESILDKFPKVPVDFAMISIMYIVVLIGCILMVTVLRGLDPHMVAYAVYTFLIVTAITIIVFLIYFFGYRLKKK